LAEGGTIGKSKFGRIVPAPPGPAEEWREERK